MMTSRLIRCFAGAALALIALTGGDARAQSRDPDPWFGRDKFYHFTVSAALASTTYAITSTQFHSRYPPLVIGAGISLSIGAGKEGLDALGFGDPSWRDFAWDVIGTIVGVGCAWAVDLATRGVSTSAPLLSDPR